jgi:hypothetical protein
MAIARMITYECTECGSEVVVTATGEIQMSPIYCCGVEVIETASFEKKQTKANKQKGKKATTKVAPKKVTQKKRPAAKKK